jgi:hypothetical protein
MMTLDLLMKGEIDCVITCNDLLEAQVEVFLFRGGRLNGLGLQDREVWVMGRSGIRGSRGRRTSPFPARPADAYRQVGSGI